MSDFIHAAREKTGARPSSFDEAVDEGLAKAQVEHATDVIAQRTGQTRVTIVCTCGRAFRLDRRLIGGSKCGTCREPFENAPTIDPDSDLVIYATARSAHLKKRGAETRKTTPYRPVSATTFACICGAEYSSYAVGSVATCGTCKRSLGTGVRLMEIAHKLKLRVVSAWPPSVLNSNRRFMFNWQNALKELTPDNAPDLERRLIESMALLEGWNRPEAKIAPCKHGNIPGECRPCRMEQLGQ